MTFLAATAMEKQNKNADLIVKKINNKLALISNKATRGYFEERLLAATKLPNPQRRPNLEHISQNLEMIISFRD